MEAASHRPLGPGSLVVTPSANKVKDVVVSSLFVFHGAWPPVCVWGEGGGLPLRSPHNKSGSADPGHGPNSYPPGGGGRCMWIWRGGGHKGWVKTIQLMRKPRPSKLI